MIVVRNGLYLERRWAQREASDHGVPSGGLWIGNSVEDKLSVGQRTGDGHCTEVEEFLRNGGVVLIAIYEDVCMNFVKFSHAVTSL